MQAENNSQKCVLVTGGAKGVGAAIVAQLVQDGYAVDFTYRSSQAQADSLITSLIQDKPHAVLQAFALDLADRAAVRDFCATLEPQTYYGFVHNAGQSYDVLAALMDQDQAEIAMQVNFWSLTQIAKALIRPMMRARTGRIVAMGSVAALQANTGNAAYAASKGALLSYCRTLAIEVAKRGVTVNVLAPGFIDTDMMTPYAAYREGMEKQIPLGRFAKPAEIAALTTFLLSESAAYITGAALPIDGGLTAHMGIHRD
jgi:3-oxoacyl-[acyl-carrier protein] reductase